MKLKAIARTLIFVGTDHSVPTAKPSDTMLVGTGTRLVPTVYEELRTQQRRRRLTMVLFITLPTLLAAIYYGILASNRYVSDTQMVMSEQSGGPSIGASLGGAAGGAKGLLSLVGMGGGDAGQTSESAIVTNYIQSEQAMEAANKAIGLRSMWGARSVDYFSRLSPRASQENFHKYYQKHITIVADPMDPIIEIKAEAFNPQDAQLIARTLVQLAQAKLDTAFTGMREDALEFARSEVARAEEKLTSINDKLRAFRNAHSELDPAASAQGVSSVTTGLFAQLAATEAELRTTLSYARPDSPAVKNLNARIDALKKQVAENRGLLAGDQRDKSYADLIASYEDLILDQKFAQEAYTSAMSFLETNRASLAHQHAYLVDFLSPTLPEEATEPRGARNVLLVFFASGLLWLIGSLVTSALREQAHR